MSFYISPPDGNISLQKLTQFTVARFKFLSKVYDTGGDRLKIFDILNDTDNVKDSECLIEGTVKDRLSHFILRLACCSNSDMVTFFLKAETLLFDFRFTCMTEEELCRLFKSTDNLKKVNSYRNNISSDTPFYIQQFFRTLTQIKGSHLKWRPVVRKYLQGEDDCFMVPFSTVLQFVATRQVSLKQGIAYVPVCKLRETVTSLFEELLQNGIKQAAKVFHTDDRRIKILLKTIKVMFYKQYKNKYPGYNHCYDLCHTEIDKVAHMFPPCMSHLHRTLRMSHRLKHHSRIQYSLFLKEAGLSVHEALMFWRKEYSQSPSNQDGCRHTWSKDEGRYTYSIRHLYGLEGSRINYRGHTCSALQASYHGPHESGGCPFRHFDSSHMKDMLHTEGITSTVNIDQILQLATDKQYSQACTAYFDEKIKAMEYKRTWHKGQLKNFGKDSIKKLKDLLKSDMILSMEDAVDDDNFEEDLKCCCHNNVACAPSENKTHCCHCKAHCCDCKGSCEYYADSEKELSTNNVVSKSKSRSETTDTTCSSITNTGCSHDKNNGHVLERTRISNNDFQRGKCSNIFSIHEDESTSSDTCTAGLKLNLNQNVIKTKENEENPVHELRNPPAAVNDFNKTVLEHDIGCVTARNSLFHKPVEYFENFKSITD